MISRFFYNGMQYAFIWKVYTDYITIKNYDTEKEKKIRVHDSIEHRIEINERTREVKTVCVYPADDEIHMNKRLLTVPGGVKTLINIASLFVDRGFIDDDVKKIIEYYNI